MKIGLLQLNPTIGDFTGNFTQICSEISQIHDKVDLVVAPELALSGYPPQDWLIGSAFQDLNQATIDDLCAATRQWTCGVLIGSFWIPDPETMVNGAMLIENGNVVCRWGKSQLPNTDVFDEYRYFQPGQPGPVISYRGIQLGVLICEDVWAPNREPFRTLCSQNATHIFVLNASPFEVGKLGVRIKLIQSLSQENNVTTTYVNQVGANDGLIFDGASFVCNSAGNIITQLPAFSPASQIVDTEYRVEHVIEKTESCAQVSGRGDSDSESIYLALRLGIRDYFAKTGFSTAILGLSGGIDSAVVACVAADALGPDRVLGIMMPSQFSSSGSIQDSIALATQIGIQTRQIEIETIRNTVIKILGLDAASVAAENIQARIRGMVVMAIANDINGLALATGNKSELAVGYCTLYGDMNGAIAPIGDLFKTEVYKLAAYLNRESMRIPDAILHKPPSAELRPNQTDQDSLPPYDVLDTVLKSIIVAGESVASCIQKGVCDAATGQWIQAALVRTEHKRRQAPIVIRVSAKAFGTGWRMPVAGHTEFFNPT